MVVKSGGTIYVDYFFAKTISKFAQFLLRTEKVHLLAVIRVVLKLSQLYPVKGQQNRKTMC